MIIALASRRIDADDVPTPRFPPENGELVRERLRDVFLHSNATTLVASGACGADLLAMEVAASLVMERFLVLPFARGRFLKTSIIDRCGNWGNRFEDIWNGLPADSQHRIIGHTSHQHPDSDYARASSNILKRALRVWKKHRPDQLHSSPKTGILAVIVWDGRSRGPGDLTEAFAVEACQKGITVEEILTM